MNDLCGSPARQFERVEVIGLKSDELEQTIYQLKYWTEWEGRWGWCVIHARIVLGYLYANPAVCASVDAIIPNPGRPAVRKGQPSLDYIATTIEEAIKQDDHGLPFVLAPPLIVKTTETKRMREAEGKAARKAVGTELYNVLRVPEPARVHGKTIMVYDDVFTMGETLNAVARRLREAGAAKVVGLALARQPRW
ncbi:ComF family protein [Nonomuraea recticatena]